VSPRDEMIFARMQRWPRKIANDLTPWIGTPGISFQRLGPSRSFHRIQSSRLWRSLSVP
jgi:hypothetical protein